MTGPGPHPLAALIPAMAADEYAALAADVAAHGLRQAIVLHEGKVLDGRHRLRACADAGVEPRFVDYHGDDPVAEVISLNVARRHLTASQRAVVALDAERVYAEQARERMVAGVRQPCGTNATGSDGTGRARDLAANALGVSGRYVADAKRLAGAAPDLVDAVRAGAQTLPDAMRELDRRKRAARRSAAVSANPPAATGRPAQARYLVGDVRDGLASLPDHSVDLVLCSPPFLALRSYLPADHPDKAREMGSEPTPGEFIDALLDVVAGCRRVLAPHGSIAIELGDTYAGSGGAGGDYGDGGLRDGQPLFDGSGRRGANRVHGDGHRASIPARRVDGVAYSVPNAGPGWPLPKSLCAIPAALQLALAYGRNPLTGTASPAGQWRVRNDVAWVRPNPPVGALGDKFRPATSHLLVACLAADRYFDLDAVREPSTKAPAKVRVGQASASRGIPGGDSDHPEKERPSHNPAGAPPLDWWPIATQPYEGAHYAAWPEQLCVVPIKAMCPEHVCTVCGRPSRRVVDAAYVPHGANHPDEPRLVGIDRLTNPSAQGFGYGRATKLVETVGWTDCGHDAWRTGVVLDPFAGSGTTLKVATDLGRDAIGIDLDERNADLARQRVGPWLAVERATGGTSP